MTEVTQDGKFFAQHVDEGPKLEQLMKQIREEFTSNPPLAGVYQPKKGKITLIEIYANFLISLSDWPILLIETSTLSLHPLFTFVI